MVEEIERHSRSEKQEFTTLFRQDDHIICLCHRIARMVVAEMSGLRLKVKSIKGQSIVVPVTLKLNDNIIEEGDATSDDDDEYSSELDDDAEENSDSEQVGKRGNDESKLLYAADSLMSAIQKVRARFSRHHTPPLAKFRKLLSQAERLSYLTITASSSMSKFKEC